MIHTPRLAKQFATHFSTLDDFFADTDQGRLAAYSFIEPNLLHAHNDYHPAYNAIVPGLSADPVVDLGRRNCSLASIPPSAPPPRRLGPTTPTRCSWSASTSMAAPMTTSRRRALLRPTRRPLPDRWASASTDRASASRYLPSPLHRPEDRRDRGVPQHVPDTDAQGALLPRATPHRARCGCCRHRPDPHAGCSATPGGLARGHPSPGASAARPDGPDGQAATGQQARDYMTDRQARIWPGLTR
jgi:hypothetical protein